MNRHSPSDDPHALERFVAAQRGSYGIALSELKQGRKQSHWMWFIFPQLRGLGQSSMSHLYGIADLDEAQHYLAHPVLGQRLITCAQAVLIHAHMPATAIFGTIDATKLRSSATLFAAAGKRPSVFDSLIETFFDGQSCRITAERLRSTSS
ncbi:MAG: DUF1810 domain-containing protein [Alphaproteobacteria bacterium]|nr:DUF1810 domain-containing protein [Alphaproteobacteria bacterium]